MTECFTFLLVMFPRVTLLDITADSLNAVLSGSPYHFENRSFLPMMVYLPNHVFSKHDLAFNANTNHVLEGMYKEHRLPLRNITRRHPEHNEVRVVVHRSQQIHGFRIVDFKRTEFHDKTPLDASCPLLKCNNLD